MVDEKSKASCDNTVELEKEPATAASPAAISRPQEDTLTGIVKWFNLTNKYGVIKISNPTDSPDPTDFFVYMNKRRIPGEQSKRQVKLYDGIEVTFLKAYDSSKNRYIATEVNYKENSKINMEILKKINKIDMCISHNTINSISKYKLKPHEVTFVNLSSLAWSIAFSKNLLKSNGSDIIDIIQSLKVSKNTKTGKESKNSSMESSNTSFQVGGKLSLFQETIDPRSDLGKLIENCLYYSEAQKDSPDRAKAPYILIKLNKPSQGASEYTGGQSPESKIQFMMKIDCNEYSLMFYSGTVYAKEITLKHNYSFVKNSFMVKKSHCLITGGDINKDWKMLFY